jgi:hypothetical protein
VLLPQILRGILKKVIKQNKLLTLLRLKLIYFVHINIGFVPHTERVFFSVIKTGLW